MAERFDAVIVGAGVAGLACAVHLHASGSRVAILEASTGIGGRVGSEIVAGNILDTGAPFLFLGAPEIQRFLDLDALELRRYERGVLLRTTDETVRLVHPGARPAMLLSSVKAPIGSITDKARLVKLLHDLDSRRVPALGAATGATLRDRGFSDAFIDDFFSPLLGALAGDTSLRSAAGFDEELLRLFWSDGVGVPARGMQAVPDQLATRLPAETVRLQSQVTSVGSGSVVLDDGRRIEATSVVVAVPGEVASSLCGIDLGPAAARSASVMHFSAPEPPFADPMPFVVRAGTSLRMVTVPTLVSARYRSGGGHLVAVRATDSSSAGDSVAPSPAEVRDELRAPFGDSVDRWNHLRTYDVPGAWPSQEPQTVSSLQRSVQPEGIPDGVYVCGDHRESATIHGALLSGRRAADAILTTSR